MQTKNAVAFDTLYPTPVIRGARIARLGQKYLGPVATDAATCRTLGEEQFGWFVGGVPTYERMIDHVARINDSNIGGRWIIVPATKCLAEVAYEQWFEDNAVEPKDNADKRAITMWHDENVTFSVPERLGELADAIIEQSVPVAGIILLDPNCIVHRGRGFIKGNGTRRVAHDRPQLIVNFRSKIGVNDWCPPLIVMSRHKAAAVSTADITRVYCLEAMVFIDGANLSCGVIKNSIQKDIAKPGQYPTVLVSH
jgi:hypothetical protein